MPTFLALIFNSFPKSQQLTVHKQNNEKQNMKIFLFKQLQYSEFKKSFCFFLDEFGSNDLNVLKLDPFQRKLIWKIEGIWVTFKSPPTLKDLVKINT